MSEHLTLKEAVKFIEERVNKPNDKDHRAWENLIRTRLNRDLTKDDNRKYSFNDLLVHARKWYGLEPFKDCPVSQCVIYATGASVSHSSCTAFAIVTPGNHDECQALFSKLYSEIYQLKEEIKNKENVIARLKPDAEKYRKICANNQNSARKKR